MAKKNFMAYGDAETIFTEYAGSLNRKLNCFTGTLDEFMALPVAVRKKYEYILDTTGSPSPSIVRYFTISASDWEANAGTDATEFPYVYNLPTTAYGTEFVPAEVLLLGSSYGEYPSASEQADIALVDKYIKFSATGVRLRATDEPTNSLTLVIVDGSASGSSGGGGGLYPRLLITSTVPPTITKPSGGTATATLISGNNYYYDAPEWGTYIVTQTIGGVTANIPINVNTCKVYNVADKTTFEGIQQILNSHMEADLLEVGDEVSVTLSGNEPMTWVVSAINHEQQHQVIFTPKWCLATARQMNTTETNVGGWNSSALRAWLNGDFYTNLPDSVKPYIKDRTFQTSQGNKSTALQSATDKIWLPREYEIFGETVTAVATEHTNGNAEQFPIFAVAANRIKTTGQSGSAYWWWESSPHASYATTFCGVTSSGTAGGNVGSASARGVAPCFHMLADD